MLINLHPETNIPPATGRILISEPFLADPYFKRTIVLLCEYNKQGSFGFILNKFVNLKIEDLLEGFPAFKTRLSVGGPVQSNNMYYIHTHGDKISGALKIKDNVYMGGDFEEMQNLVSTGIINSNDIRFFIGYSGWDEDQLERELEEKSWFVTDIGANQIMDTAENNLWEAILKSMGSDYELLTQFPEDPSLN
jgi:putative transcriptional regulator